MPQVSFPKMSRQTTIRAGETILDAARRAGVPIANSCGDTGICGRCRVTVEPVTSLDSRTQMEQRLAGARGFSAEERLACQAIVRDDCVVSTTYW